jgi:hypothetical protein
MFQRICFILSYVALAGVLLAPMLYFADVLDKSAMKTAMSIATLVWFVCGGIVRARSRVM